MSGFSGENVPLGLEEQDTHVEVGDRVAGTEFDGLSQPFESILEAASLLMQEPAEHMQTGAVFDVGDAAVELDDREIGIVGLDAASA